MTSLYVFTDLMDRSDWHDGAAGERVYGPVLDGVRYPPYDGAVTGVRKMPDYRIDEDDIVISAYPKSGYYGDWFTYAIAYNEFVEKNKDRYLVVNYEEMKLQPQTHTRRIAEHLLYPITDDDIDFVLEMSSVENMRARMARLPDKDTRPFREALYRKVRSVTGRTTSLSQWTNGLTPSTNGVWQARTYDEPLSTDFLPHGWRGATFKTCRHEHNVEHISLDFLMHAIFLCVRTYEELLLPVGAHDRLVCTSIYDELDEINGAKLQYDRIGCQLQ